MTSLVGESEVLTSRWREWIEEWGLPIGITLLAAILRVFALDRVPPGLYHDEAFNGLDALTVLDGQWAIYFAANNGREPLFIYLVALTVGVLGRTPGALRLAAAICGTLTIPTTYLMLRAWFNRRVGLLGAAILATTLWHVHLSRIGFRAITLPLTTSLALWLGARAYRSRHRSDWFLAGLAYGLCYYAYLPARLTPLILILFGLYLYVTDRGSALLAGGGWFAIGTLIILSPLVIYAVAHWDVVVGRPLQVSAFNPLISGGDPWATLGPQLIRTLGMFFIRGDTIPRHNVPGRPIFDPLMGAAMVVGVWQAIRRARKQAASAFTLIWVGLMLAPTWLAEDAPHFLRAVGILPLLVALPALGLDALMGWLRRRVQRRWALGITCVILSASLAQTTGRYFIQYRQDPQTAYAFESAAVALAAEANRFTGTGWRDAQNTPPPSDRHVYIDERLWNEWTAIPFLIPPNDRIHILSADIIPADPPSQNLLFILWPYDARSRYQYLLPPNTRIEAHGGPLTKGDLEETPYEAYVALTVEPRPQDSNHHLARFGSRQSGAQIALTGCAVTVNGSMWNVQLAWEALTPIETNYTVFVHLRVDGQTVAQDDGEPATGHYPTSLWRMGDIIVDVHTLKAAPEWRNEAKIVTGLYVWPTMEPLDAIAPNGGLLNNEAPISCQMNVE